MKTVLICALAFMAGVATVSAAGNAKPTKSTAAAVPAASKILPWEKNRMLIAEELYRSNCVVCHDVDKPQSESKKFGPSFYQLFKRPKMPLANMPPNRAYIAGKIRFGGPLMPSFAKKLNAGEIDLIIDYLQTK